MKKTVALIATGSLMAIAAPAMAQSAADREFQGPWVAGVVGYDINKAGSSQRDGLNPDDDRSVKGLMYGAAVGYDVDTGSVVIGGEAELTDSLADSDFDNNFNTFGLGEVDAGRDIYVGARVGFKATPQTLVYGKAGYTNARFNFVGSDGTTEFTRNIDTDGYRLGAGVEQKVGRNAFAKLEYRYSNYKEGEVDFEANNIADSDRFDIDTDRHQVVASVGLRF